MGLMRELSIKTDSKIVLLVLDGLGGVPSSDGETELEAAIPRNWTPWPHAPSWASPVP